MQDFSINLLDKWQNYVKEETSKINPSFKETDLKLWINKFMCLKDEINKKFIDPCLENLFIKSDNLSNKSRIKGNEYYSKNNFESAMQFYNQAITTSVHGNDQLALAFSNRSALFYQMKNYLSCLCDIANALVCNYNSKYKLYTRKGQCLIHLEKYEEAHIAFELSLNDLKNEIYEDEIIEKESNKIKKWSAKICRVNNIDALNNKNLLSLLPKKNSKLSSASHSIFSSYLPYNGRHILAENEIKAGEVIFVEKSYAFILLPEFYRYRCYHCLKTINAYFPCRSCDKISFCCSECENDAWQQYHHIECNFQAIFYAIGVAHLSLKIILIAGLQFLLDIRPDLNDVNLNDVLFFKNNYLAVYSLLTHHEKMHLLDISTYTMTSVLLLEILKRSNYFSILNINDYDFDVHTYIGSLLLRHICQLVCNGHAITAVITQAIDNKQIATQKQTRIATAIYPTTSLMNHSCIPNVISSFENDVLIVRVIKDIQKGDEIFNCYGPHYLRMNKEERKLSLKEQYFFDCACLACQNGPDDLKIFICAKCGGKVILKSKYGCLDCKSEPENLQTILDMAKKADNLFSISEKLLYSDDLKNALEFGEQSVTIRRKIYHHSSKDLASGIDLLAHCNACLGDFESAYACLKESVDMIGEYYGHTSIEYANELVKYIDICLQANKSKNMINDLIIKTEKIFLIHYGFNCQQIRELNALMPK